MLFAEPTWRYPLVIVSSQMTAVISMLSLPLPADVYVLGGYGGLERQWFVRSVLSGRSGCGSVSANHLTDHAP